MNDKEIIMSVKKVVITFIVALSLLGCLWAQEPVASESSGQRVPLVYMAIVGLILAILLHYHILNKKFMNYLESNYSPQSAAASCLIFWLTWVGLIFLILIGIDVINIDFYHIGDHLIGSIIRIAVIVVAWIAIYLIISPYKRSSNNKQGGQNG